MIPVNQSADRIFQEEQTNQFVLDHRISSFQQFKKKDVTCIQIYQDHLYIGTKEAQVLVYQMAFPKGREEKGSENSDKQSRMIQLTNLRHFYPHCDAVHSIVASEKYLIVVPLQGQQLIRIWDRKPLQIVNGYKGHDAQISEIIFLKGEKNFVSIGYDGTARVWSLSQVFSQDTQCKKYNNKYPILSVIELNETTIVFGGDDCYITFWDWKDDLILYRHFGHPGSLSCLTLKYPHILSVGGDSKIKIWEIQEQQANFGKLLTYALLNSIQDIKNKTRLHVKQLKNQQIQSNFSQKCFGIRLTINDLMIIDSRGKIFLVNMKLVFKTSKLDLQYNETIHCIKMVKNYLFYVTTKGDLGQLKYRTAKIDHLLAAQEQTDIKEQENEEPTIKNAFLGMFGL